MEAEEFVKYIIWAFLFVVALYGIYKLLNF